jgi:hypothetical protein
VGSLSRLLCSCRFLCAVLASLALNETRTTPENSGATRARTQNETSRKGLGTASGFHDSHCGIDYIATMILWRRHHLISY